MKEQDYYLLDVLKRNRKICISLILIILVGIVLIIAAVALDLQASYQISIDEQIASSLFAVMITAVITWFLIVVLNIIFVLNNLKIKNYFKEDGGFWIAMSILVFFFTLIIVSISLNRINEYIKTLKTN